MKLHEINFPLRSKRTIFSYTLGLIDVLLFMHCWYFKPFQVYSHYQNNNLSRMTTVRRTLNGVVVSWGLAIDYYENGTKMAETECYLLPIPCFRKYTKYTTYWLEDGTVVNQDTWIEHMLPADSNIASTARGGPG